jgi:hypothetical protein
MTADRPAKPETHMAPRIFHPDARASHAATEADFIPQIARDYGANKAEDVLTAIGASPMITAEVALYLFKEHGAAEAKAFLKFIVSHSRR